ncbi:MAG: hypothetical protein QM785_04385 [Pyrinomonadaceae bacterium]
MKPLFLLILVFSVSSIMSFAQNEPSQCPTVKIKTPYGPLRLGIEHELDVEVDPTEMAGKLGFLWQLSNGIFVSGQGSKQPKILMTKELAGMNVRVGVRITGLPPGCPSELAEDLGVEARPPIDPVDGFGNLKSDDLKARIDNFFIQINSYPHSEGFIFVTFGENEADNTRLQRLERIFKAVSFRNYDLTRLTFLINLDFGEPITYFWFLSPGADLPETGEKTTLIKGEDLIKNPRKALPKKRT